MVEVNVTMSLTLGLGCERVVWWGWNRETAWQGCLMCVCSDGSSRLTFGGKSCEFARPLVLGGRFISIKSIFVPPWLEQVT